MAISCPKCRFENPEGTLYCGQCGAALKTAEGSDITKTVVSSAESLRKGTTLAGRYTIIEELGRGGMGVVYKAEDTKLKRTVALKFLPPELTHVPEVKARFIREAQAAAALDHPNICTVHEFDETEATTFISMAYVEGQSLRKKIESGPLGMEEAINIATQVAEGLQEAHKKGIVHRDIKSGNILVTDNGQVKIMDFGLARKTEGTLLTREGSTMGTIAYMSPEQAKGEKVDHRTDIWSFGVVLYEMLTGQLPFRGEHEQAVVYSIRKDKPEPISNVKPEISASIEQVVNKALEKNPDKRYQQIDDLLDDLKSISAGIVPEEIRTRIKKEKLRKRKRAFLYGGAATLVISAVVLALLLFTGPAEAIDSIAVLPLENMTGDAEQQYFVDGVTDELIGQLGQISGLQRVISRTSVMRYKDTEKSLPEIAQELKVDALVEGTVYQVGENVSIKLQLFDALPEERNLWTKRYDRPKTDVLVMYAEMARAIADNIQVKLTADETSRFADARQVDPESYDAYLKGLPHLNKLTPEGIKIAQQYFDLALEIEPNNALAHVGISLVWMDRYQMGIASRQESLPLTKAAIEKALELDNTLAEAHWALGAIKCWDEWDWEGAEKEFLQAYRLNPNHAGAHGAYSQLLCHVRRINEALPHIELALELDPLNPMWHLFYGIVLSHHCRYDDAIAAYRTALDIAPNYPIALGNLAGALGEKGMYNEKFAIYRRIHADDAELTMALEDGFEKAGCMGAYRGLADLKADWYRKPGKNVAAKEIADAYLEAGNYDLAIDWYEKAYEEHDPNLPYISMVGNPLRSHPRFQELLRKMNLPVGKQKEE
ncbi:MAG: protein kinase [Candidatus Aminicenantes bacterium]|nr:protein kinase [Candidatus Aminicenantes bacterium]